VSLAVLSAHQHCDLFYPLGWGSDWVYHKLGNAPVLQSGTGSWVLRDIEKFIIRQPSIEEKDDDDSENSWISDGLPSSSSRRRRKGDGRWEVGEWREK